MSKTYIWQEVKGVITPGGDPCYKCPKCGWQHVYGVESFEGPYNKCPKCGVPIVYPWQEITEPILDEISGFNAEKEIDAIVKWIQDWFEENGPKSNAVIGISGGKDSTIVAALLVRALGKDRVFGVMMPNGEQADINDSKQVVEILGIKSYVINIENAYNGILNEVKNAIKYDDTIQNITSATTENIPPRLRMTTLYAVAQSLPEGGIVVGTGNKSEIYIGYFTKGGDGMSDIKPCSEYLVSEMLQIGDALGLPYELVHKIPSDGLCGKSDEDKLGFTYAQLDKYILTGQCEDEAIKAKIDRLHRINLHKINPIPVKPR